MVVSGLLVVSASAHAPSKVFPWASVSTATLISQIDGIPLIAMLMHKKNTSFYIIAPYLGMYSLTVPLALSLALAISRVLKPCPLLHRTRRTRISCVYSVRTTNTTYYGNVGDGAYSDSSSDIGLRAQSGGCFADDSTSREVAVNSYIISHFCD